MTTSVFATETDIVLASQFTENTGRHMLDSGGAYGRAWERNAGRDVESFLSAPEVSLDARFGYVDITVDAFHWLRSILEFDPTMQRRFDLFNAGSDDPHLVDMERFAEAVDNSRFGIEAGWSAEGWQSYNTYNGESWLSSVLQYVVFSWEGDDYVLLQVHGGCDVRGGYTAPKAYRLTGYDGRFDLYREGYVSLHCTEHHGQSLGEGLFGEVWDAAHVWSSDSSGVEWVDHDGSYVTVEFETEDTDDGSHVKCPECGAPLEVSVFFGS